MGRGLGRDVDTGKDERGIKPLLTTHFIGTFQKNENNLEQNFKIRPIKDPRINWVLTLQASFNESTKCCSAISRIL